MPGKIGHYWNINTIGQFGEFKTADGFIRSDMKIAIIAGLALKLYTRVCLDITDSALLVV